ncbi:MAG: hypothetical protein J0M08_12060 [Bacteroidetes bacterium]|nr:hypothetical protein [Bacteroidota bacterium]
MIIIMEWNTKLNSINDGQALKYGRDPGIGKASTWYKPLDNTNNDTIDSYVADISSSKDYGAFGEYLTNRNFNRNEYPNSFNGKRDDNELFGWQDYGFRNYLKGTRRFDRHDELFINKKYPELSPFQFGSNNPIQNIDVDGLEGTNSLLLPLNPTAHISLMQFSYSLITGNYGVLISSDKQLGSQNLSGASKAKPGMKLIEIKYETFDLLRTANSALDKASPYQPVEQKKVSDNRTLTEQKNTGKRETQTTKAGERATNSYENADFADQSQDSNEPVNEDEQSYLKYDRGKDSATHYYKIIGKQYTNPVGKEQAKVMESWGVKVKTESKANQK